MFLAFRLNDSEKSDGSTAWRGGFVDYRETMVGVRPGSRMLANFGWIEVRELTQQRATRLTRRRDRVIARRFLLDRDETIAFMRTLRGPHARTEDEILGTWSRGFPIPPRRIISLARAQFWPLVRDTATGPRDNPYEPSVIVGVIPSAIDLHEYTKDLDGSRWTQAEYDELDARRIARRGA